MPYAKVSLTIIVNTEQAEETLESFKALAASLSFEPDIPNDALHSVKITKEDV